MIRHGCSIALISTLLAAASAQTARPTPPTRDPHTPGYVAATELPDGTLSPATADGNFILGSLRRTAGR